MIEKTFTDQKWRLSGSHTKWEYNIFQQPELVKVNEFRMTRAYVRFNDEKRLLRMRTEVRVMKSRLDYEYKTYGEIDDIDFNDYLNMVNEYEREKSKFEAKYGELTD